MLLDQIQAMIAVIGHAANVYKGLKEHGLDQAAKMLRDETRAFLAMLTELVRHPDFDKTPLTEDLLRHHQIAMGAVPGFRASVMRYELVSLDAAFT